MPESSSAPGTKGTSTTRLVLSWALVALPLLWGVSQTLTKALALFR